MFFIATGYWLIGAITRILGGMCLMELLAKAFVNGKELRAKLDEALKRTVRQKR
jgi:hypothetical protein